MFAQRFDPTQLVVETASEAVKEQEIVIEQPLKKVIPLKRVNETEDDSESESESSSESSSESEGEAKIDIETNDVEIIQENEDEETKPSKHTAVLSRFQKSLVVNERTTLESREDKDEQSDDNEGQSNLHDLEQIPQPDIVRSSLLAPGQTFKQLRQSNLKSTAFLNTEKIIYDNKMIKDFKDYSNLIDQNLLNNVVNNFSDKTFPIQTILLDTLLPTINFTAKTTKKNFTKRVGDVLVNSSTGSGKTLAYSIPLIQSLFKRTVNKLRAIIIVPTKILINQIFDTLSKLSKGTSLIISISKLENSLKDEHEKFINNEPDILIITPGRLVDHLNLNSISLKNLKFLILDEADKLLNQSFQNWCNELFIALENDKSLNKSDNENERQHLPGNVIKMIFSATLTTNTSKLHQLSLYNPKLFMTDSIKLYNLPHQLQEYNLMVPTAKSLYKPLILFNLLNSNLNKLNSKIFIFVKSNENSLRLNSLLNIIMNSKLNNRQENLFTINTINSNNSKLENRKLLNNFTNSQSNNILITTDIMSRGVDVVNITDVINYDLPISSQQYVHRCGRTARANTSGTAFNILVGKGERNFWTQHIDDDISREVDGLPVKEIDDNENIINLSKEQESIYTECLETFKRQAEME